MRALILVDLQNDFLPGGALAVPHGDEVLPVAARLATRFQTIVATQDWHPPGHQSFAAEHAGRAIGEVIELDGLPQVLWPVHCVQGTRGAEFAAGADGAPIVDPARVAAVFQKGTNPRIDSYSGFFDNGHRQATGLGDWLLARGVDEVVVLGLATDYCVKWTALDAVRLGFRVTFVADASRGVELAPGDVAAAIAEMAAAGVRIAQSADVGED